jgi:PHD/YefM family antitoxin component YafN of YafNO toxin-antitoxin module
MIDLSDIRPLTDFKRNTVEFRERLRSLPGPIVLTVGGRAEMIVQSAEGYQALLNELRDLKVERLRAAVDAGAAQADRGEFADYRLEGLIESLDAE